MMRIPTARVVIGLALSALLAGVLPAASATDEGIVLVGSISIPGAVSGKVIEQDGRPRWMYVSAASGFLVYDLADPAKPTEVGRLPLPTYQNEDLDATDDRALLTDDVPVSAPGSPVGGQLVVVSTADKAHPVPVAHVALPDGAGHTASCIEHCRWVYASLGASLVAVDLRNVTDPVVHRVPLPPEVGHFHDAEQDEQGVVWLSGYAGTVGLAVAPLSSQGAVVAARTRHATPVTPVLLTSTGRPGTSPAIGAGILHGSLRPREITYAATSGLQPGDVLFVGQEITQPSCADGGRFHAFDARGLRSGQPLRLLDSIAPAEQASSVTKDPGSGCSAHWFTQQGQLAAVAWYGAGLRILDLSNPRRLRQVGRYVPTDPHTWSAYWIRGTPYVYALDLHRGLDVLRVEAHAGGPAVGTVLHGPSPAPSLAQITARDICAVPGQRTAPVP